MSILSTAGGLFEIALGRGWLSFAEKVLRVAKSLEQRAWNFRHPLRQFNSLSCEVYDKLEGKRASVETLREMSANEIGDLVNHQRLGSSIKAEANRLPQLDVQVHAQPITRTVLRVTLTLTASFEWVDRHHSGSEPWWIWVEDTENEHIYHKELWVLSKAKRDVAHELTFTIPLFEPLPPCYFVRAISNRWLGVETIVPLALSDLVLPTAAPAHTELLDLRPLPRSAVNQPAWESIFSFTHFNPVQTQGQPRAMLVARLSTAARTFLAALAELKKDSPPPPVPMRPDATPSESDVLLDPVVLPLHCHVALGSLPFGLSHRR